jgi:GDPmannose 4,6-dehydratase
VPGRTALISGVSGQDGSYLSDLLLGKGYAVHGIYRSGEPPGLPEVYRHEADLEDDAAIRGIVQRVAPDEFYHLGAQTFVLGEEIPPFG